MKQKFLDWLELKLYGFWLWFGVRLLGWKYIDIYAPNGEDGNVEGITFTNSARYAAEVDNIEIDEDDVTLN